MAKQQAAEAFMKEFTQTTRNDADDESKQEVNSEESKQEVNSEASESDPKHEPRNFSKKELLALSLVNITSPLLGSWISLDYTLREKSRNPQTTSSINQQIYDTAITTALTAGLTTWLLHDLGIGVFKNPNHSFLLDFLDNPATNWLSANLSENAMYYIALTALVIGGRLLLNEGLQSLMLQDDISKTIQFKNTAVRSILGKETAHHLITSIARLPKPDPRMITPKNTKDLTTENQDYTQNFTNFLNEKYQALQGHQIVRSDERRRVAEASALAQMAAGYGVEPMEGFPGQWNLINNEPTGSLSQYIVRSSPSPTDHPCLDQDEEEVENQTPTP